MHPRRTRITRPLTAVLCLALAALSGCVAQYRKNLLPEPPPGDPPDLSAAIYEIQVEEWADPNPSPMWHGDVQFGSALVHRLESLRVPVRSTKCSGTWSAGSGHAGSSTSGPPRCGDPSGWSRKPDEVRVEFTISQYEEGGLGMRLLRALPSILSVSLLPSWLNLVTTEVDVVARSSSGEVTWRKHYRDSYGAVFWLLAGPFASPLKKAPNEIIENMATLVANDLTSGKAFAGVTMTQRLQARLTTDPVQLAKIASEGDADAIGVAIGKLADEALLARVAVEASQGPARQAAVAKVSDRPLLQKLAAESTDPNVRKTARQALALTQARSLSGKQLSGLRPVGAEELARVRKDLEELTRPFRLAQVWGAAIKSRPGSVAHQSAPRPGTERFTFVVLADGDRVDVMTVAGNPGFAGFAGMRFDSGRNVQLPDNLEPERLAVLRRPLPEQTSGIGFGEVLLFGPEGVRDHLVSHEGAWRALTPVVE